MEDNVTKKTKSENTSGVYFYNEYCNASFPHSCNPIIFNNETDEIIFMENHSLSKKQSMKLKSTSDIIIFSSGFQFHIRVCKNGVFSWGNNEDGQLGIGNEEDNQFSAQKIEFFKNPEEIISISCGHSFCICVCKNGVFGWGDNISGQLGIGNNDDKSSPQKIPFFKNSEKIISLYCGNNFCVCVCKDGVFSWGENNDGQLGLGHDRDQYSPQKIEFFKKSEKIISLSCGTSFCVCVCKNGVFSWGDNYWKQLGIGYQDNQSSPQQILFFQNPKEIISLSCGGNFCICICKNGVFGWGNNRNGQLGFESQIQESSPKQISFFKNPEEIISLFCGESFCVCVCKNGVFSWGKIDCEKHEKLIKCDDHQSYPRQISFFKNTKSFSNLSFPQFSIKLRYAQKLLLILAREHLDPDNCLVGKDYLPWDMFKILLKMI